MCEPHGPRALAGARRARLRALPGDRRLVAAARDRAPRSRRDARRGARRSAGMTCRSRSACATGIPFIEDALRRARRRRVRPGRDGLAVAVRVAGRARARTARRSPRRWRAAGGVEVVEAPSLPRLTRVRRRFSLRRRARRSSDIEPNGGAVVVFTAHSLPLDELGGRRPYVERAARDGRRGRAAGRARPGRRSARSGSRWLPGVEAFGATQAATAVVPRVPVARASAPGSGSARTSTTSIDACAAAGFDGVVVVPIGFVTDHMETLYDLDIVAAGARARPRVWSSQRGPTTTRHDQRSRSVSSLRR